MTMGRRPRSVRGAPCFDTDLTRESSDLAANQTGSSPAFRWGAPPYFYLKRATGAWLHLLPTHPLKCPTPQGQGLLQVQMVPAQLQLDVHPPSASCAERHPLLRTVLMLPPPEPPSARLDWSVGKLSVRQGQDQTSTNYYERDAQSPPASRRVSPRDEVKEPLVPPTDCTHPCRLQAQCEPTVTMRLLATSRFGKYRGRTAPRRSCHRRPAYLPRRRSPILSGCSPYGTSISSVVTQTQFLWPQLPRHIRPKRSHPQMSPGLSGVRSRSNTRGYIFPNGRAGAVVQLKWMRLLSRDSCVRSCQMYAH